MANHENQSNPERKGRIARFLKGFNKISAAFFAAAGYIFNQPIFYALAAVDAAQVFLIGRYEKWRDKRRQNAQPIGHTALQTA